MLKALIFDVDGTLAETERDGHRVAFNLAFERYGFDWRWDEARYGELLTIAGGRERLLFDLETHDDAPTKPDVRQALAAEMHQSKNAFYAELVKQKRIGLRDGVRELMDECDAGGIVMGIATTTSASNLDALLTANLGSSWRQRFESIVVGESVRRKKPDPEVFETALRELDIDAAAAIAIEDSPAGVAAACAAGLPVIVTQSRYFAHAEMPGAIATGPGLHTRDRWWPLPPGATCPAGRIGLADIVGWHDGRLAAAQQQQ